MKVIGLEQVIVNVDSSCDCTEIAVTGMIYHPKLPSEQ